MWEKPSMTNVISKLVSLHQQPSMSLLSIHSRSMMQQMFQKIILHFNRQKAMVAKVELIEKRGDCTVIEMTNVKVNSPINAKVFTVN